MTDLKICLKEAKSAIKDKDYEAAMIHCKDALKIDKKNYQALVMFGRVCLELHRLADSKKALLLATQLDPENIIAWQGLSSLHEKQHTCFEKEEEIAILTHLRERTTDEEKLDRLYRRLASVYQRYDSPLEAVSILESLLLILKDEKHKKEVHKSIIELLESIKKPTEEALDKLINYYKSILTDSEMWENESNHQTYLRLLYKTKDLRRLTEEAVAMSRIFPTAYPLEWIARSYVEYNEFSVSRSNENESLVSDDNMKEYMEKLLRLYHGSPWGNLVTGLMRLKEGSVDAAKSYLRKGCEALSSNLSAWLSLLDAQSKTADSGGMETTCKRMKSIVEAPDTGKLPERFLDKEQLLQHLLLTRVNALLHLGRPKHLQEAVSLLKSVKKKSLETGIASVKAQVKLEMMEDACEEAANLANEFGRCPQVQKLLAFIAYSKGDSEGAKVIYEEFLQGDATDAETLFELGRIYFLSEDYQKALIYLLKAAKYRPEMSSSFVYIGHYYRLFDNMEKARKCYEKALALNPGDEDAGSSLSDIYRITGQDEENFSLLVRVTSEGRSQWAWLRLGLQYLAVRNCDDAIKALQRAVEISPRDRVCFECLGDAYLSRGSNSAALKVFTKVTELHPTDSLYSRCRIAHINNILGEFLMSISQYEQVLSEDLPEAVRNVALVGLAEVLLTRAKKYKKEQLLANMRDDCLYSIRCLTSAACQNANNFTVWKLLGDACTLLAVLPTSLSSLQVPARLLDASVKDEDLLQEITKEEIMVLGGRCYAVGLQVNESNPALWHDLSVNIFLQGYSSLKLNKEAKISPEDDQRDTEAMQDYVQRAITAVQKSLALDASSFNAWNTLGVLSFFKGDLPLAQHAFIRSLQLQPSVDGWTHLGTLYLHRKKIQLSHEAFSQAQALDPMFVASWVGQAMIATSIGHYEAFDLFRHTTLLGIHPESCLGFASNVLRVACDKNESKDVTHFIPNVADGLSFYTREKETDVIALNMLGLTQETMGMHRSAAETFHKAVVAMQQNESVEPEMRDGILSNYSRTLISVDKLPEAITNYSKLKEPDFYSHCGLALALLKACHFDEACNKYNEAYEWYAPDDIQKSHVLVAVAFLQYKFNKIDDMKTLLFKSSSIQGLLALTSLGLLLEDAILTDAALTELEPYGDSKEYAYHVAFLKATQATLQHKPREATLILSRAIHRHPNDSGLWRALSRHLLSIPTTPVEGNRIAEGANAAASVARTLAQASGENDKVFQDVVLKAMSCLKSFLAPAPPPPPEAKKKKKKKAIVEAPQKIVLTKEQQKRLSLIEAQRAVLMCPGKPETWAVLVANAMDSTKGKVSELAKIWSKDAKSQLKTWLQNASVSL